MTAKGHVLIVDDEPKNVKLLATILSCECYAISKAYCGNDAITLAGEVEPDLILLDIMMPDIDGYDVLKVLKADTRTSHIPVVLVTSLDGADNRAKGLELGADEFLSKPIHKTELLARVQSLAKMRMYEKEMQSTQDISPYTPQTSYQPSEKTILLVEDDRLLVKQIQRKLTNIGYKVESAGGARQAKEHLEKTVPDLILLDIFLPDLHGLELLDEWKRNAAYKNIPVIVITAIDDLNTKVDGIERGADDYLVKPVALVELQARVKACIRRSESYLYLKREFQRAKSQALTDSLTQIKNRLYFDTDLKNRVELSVRHGDSHFCLAMIDIDNFKTFNDNFGHLIGDAVLRLVANILQREARSSDVTARYGGEEFAIILPNTELVAAEILAERFRSAVETIACEGVGSHKITISIGLACALGSDKQPEDIIGRADAALYLAKSKGKNQVYPTG